MNCISVSRLTRREPFAWVCRKKRDLVATVYNLLLSTVLMLQNARGALFIFLCLRKSLMSESHIKSRACWLPFHKYITPAMTQFKWSIFNNIMRSYNALLGWVYAPDKQMLSPRRQVIVCAFVIRQIKHLVM